MRSRWLLNLALVILVLGLAAFLFYKRGQEEPTDESPLTALAAADITRLRLARPGQKEITLTKTGATWRLTAPLAARANPFNVERLLKLAGADSAVSFPAITGELGKFGLDKPQARAWLDDEEIAFGALHPINNQIYVRYRDRVHLIQSHYYAPASYRYTQYLDTRLLEEGRKPVRLELPDFTLTLKEGVWRRAPEDKTLSTDRINKFVEEWRHARALGVNRYKKRRALGRVRIAFAADGKTETLTLAILGYKPDFILYRKDEGLEYHFPEETGRRLLNLDDKE